MDASVSLWLPVGRANFYSVTANEWLLGAATTAGRSCSSKKIIDSGRGAVVADPNYIPLLQCSVLRRLLEVLPLTFGYDLVGRCELASDEDEPDEHNRPVAVVLALSNVATSLDVVANPDDAEDRFTNPDAEHRPDAERTLAVIRRKANQPLRAAGVNRVQLRADEHGNYTFTAAVPEPGGERQRDAVVKALTTHAREVFGGDFAVRRFEPQPRRGAREGGAAVRRYNGLTEASLTDATHGEELVGDVVGPPRGVLTFFQLNTLVEGICNDTLWPAVFFERYDFMKQWRQRNETPVSLLDNIGKIIDIIRTDVDAATPDGQITVLRHFLAVTARESLQKIKWSVESVRRSLLDEMMSVLHRQSRLIQLDLGAIKRERSPELAIEASESQLRGYVMLAAAKLPLVSNVHEIASLAADHLSAATDGTNLSRHGRELQVQLSHWKLLLEGLGSNIRSLEKAVEQAWMERLLYEEVQARSEQEAMAEIERSRFGRPEGRSMGRTTYDAFNLFVSVVAILFVLATTKLPSEGGDWRQLTKLWPVGLIAVLFYFIPPGVGSLLRWRRERKGTSNNYSYEFAFQLDEPTTPDLVKQFYLNRRRRQRIRRRKTGPPAQLRSAAESGHDLALPQTTRRVRGLTLARLGGGRIERVSADSSSLKLHAIVAFRVAPFKYARFEIVNEILASRVSDQPRYLLHQVRMFGDSPRPLDPDTAVELINVIHNEVVLPLAVDKNVDDPLNLLRVFYQD